jgi:hypothetical protein
VKVRAVSIGRDALELTSSAPATIQSGSRLAVARGAQALGWFEPDADEARNLFTSTRSGRLPADVKHLRAWLVPPDLTARLRSRWPLNAELHAVIDSVGPGAQSVWIAGGANLGVRVGESWWLRRAGQPIARFDVRLVQADLSHCRVQPLVSDLPPLQGRTVALWPAPGWKRTGRARSAVSFVEVEDAPRTIWVPPPPGVDAPAEPSIDFFRDGRFVGCGVVERRDARFWYVRRLVTTAGDPIRVGDEAVVRTRADIAARRFIARVFEATADGLLINAGENDGLAPGAELTVRRAGRIVGRGSVRRVQREYAVVRPLTEPASHEILPGDEIRFRPPPKAPLVLGVIERVVQGTLFDARIDPAAPPPLQTPLAVHSTHGSAGVAVLLARDGARAFGLALPAAAPHPLQTGMRLLNPAADPKTGSVGNKSK